MTRKMKNGASNVWRDGGRGRGIAKRVQNVTIRSTFGARPTEAFFFPFVRPLPTGIDDTNRPGAANNRRFYILFCFLRSGSRRLLV